MPPVRYNTAGRSHAHTHGNIYIHLCRKCKYIITQKDWDRARHTETQTAIKAPKKDKKALFINIMSIL